ncbi:response regulator [Alkalihalophilus lindianensis]|uniref:Response regulator n=1 Tax=Alkalihalophilus lindianensis TaxID=1630542 RepID=A0ABU3XFM5_9BACI|nr:response regulator [Alkalihalophilus lindianensis]MDV2686417.1 response regulator [Alkalihalophilus lindianensis]
MIRAIVVDDEMLAMEFMKRKLNELGGVEVVAAYTDSKKVLKEMHYLDFDVAFLDIDMGGVNGIDLAEHLINYNKDIQIVFATAYQEYAIKAFELNSIDYLLKPIRKERLVRTVERLQKNNIHQNLKRKEAATLSVTSLGELLVTFSGDLIKWKTAKVKELFAYLLTYHESYVDRDILIEHLWPGSDYHKAKIYLHTSISYLRQLLKGFGYEEVIMYQNNKYKLKLGRFIWDLHLFDSVEKIQQITSKHEIEKIKNIQDAYNGDYLQNEGYDWAKEKAECIRSEYIRLLEMLYDYYSVHNENKNCINILNRLLKYNPYSETYIRQLMIAYIELGDRVEAINLYQDFKNKLDENLGILPDKLTISLYVSILN